MRAEVKNSHQNDKIQELTASDIDEVSGGGFRIANGPPSWETCVENFGYIKGTWVWATW